MNAPAMKPPKPPPKPPPQPMRNWKPPVPTWTLADVSSGVQDVAKRLMLSGIEGIGKSTFGANAPSPIFLGVEDGSLHLPVKRTPKISRWVDALHAVDLLVKETHPFKTCVVDTVDHLEPLLWDHICERDDEKSIESYGFGKGYTAALDEWRRFLRKLEALRAKDINVLLIAHTHLKAFKNPQGPDFDRYELKLNIKAGGLLKEWCDAVLFAAYETWSVKEDKKDKKGKGVSNGQRSIYTERTAAYDAKNRFGLPPQLPLSWDEFELAVQAGKPQDPTLLIEQINRQAALLDDGNKKKVAEAIGRASGDASKLTTLLHIVNNTPTAEQLAAEQEA